MLTFQELLQQKADFNKQITQQMKNMKHLSVEEKKKLGQKLNYEKKEFYDMFNKKKLELERFELNKKLEASKIDVTLPGKRNCIGSINLITHTINQLLQICSSLGFDIYDGPSVDTDWYNFEALNFIKDHPARNMSDTFFINSNYILRTHTSNMQIRVMEKQKPPLKFASIGRVYRNDSDATHVPMFHQFEGVVVNDKVNLIELKSMLQYILESFFGQNIKMRFRNSYFPFTSPSFEVDIFLNGKWLEILGSGMIHKHVFDNCKLDNAKGYAFGIGIERLIMIKFGIKDIRLLFSGDRRYMSQINIKNF
ncbi:MAG: phenylalanine--tRNA ligase subunit alpha [Pseudomonadota bacterium]